MKKLIVLILAIGVLSACNTDRKKIVDNTKKATNTYECELFSVTYPDGYYAKIDSVNSFRRLSIGKDSVNPDETMIMWESPNDFPGNACQFVTVFEGSAIKDFEEAGTFYNIIEEDSTYTIDGFPTYSIVSVFEENADTIIQSRTGLIIPGKLDMMILQRTNTKNSDSEVKKNADILKTIKFKS